MKRVFIYNSEIKENFNTNNILIDENFDIEKFSVESVDKIGDTIFIIDVHCVFKIGKRKLKSQEQGGVIIYRKLLQEFKGCEDKLKVIFYSPISQPELVKLKPENYVLKLLPFLELFPEEQDDWKFNSALEDTEKKVCPQFSNASENLLSGWALYNDEKIKKGKDEEAKISLRKKKLLIIDDEFIYWKKTYQTIFKSYETEIKATDYSTKIEFRKAWKNNTAQIEICNQLIEADAVLSDLYLKENHEDTKPYKTKKDIEKISGFDVMKAVKKRFPYVPYMMFTSSNKVWNAEAFRSKGVWAWAVKENSHSVRKEDKKAKFEHFKDCIDKLIQKEWQFVTDVWKQFLILSKSQTQNYWWFPIRPDALDLIEDCLRMLDTIYSQRATFETHSIKEFDGRLCSQICNNLGGLCETLNIHPTGENPRFVSSYIFGLRNLYSHHLNYRFAKPIQALFCIDIFLKLLSLTSDEFDQLNKTKKIITDRIGVIHTNLNYLLQFRDYSSTDGSVEFDGKLLDYIMQSLAHVKDKSDIISTHYQETIKTNKNKLREIQNKINENNYVINLIDNYIKLP